MTGYTSSLVDKDLNFPSWTMECARAFGALVMMRDDPMGATIPERFEPSDYYQKQIVETEGEIARIEGMSERARNALGYQMKDERIQMLEKLKREGESRIAKMQATMDQVEAWEPPTRDHEGLKTFMREQLAESIRFEGVAYYEKGLEVARERKSSGYVDEHLDECKRKLEYSHQHHREELERTETRNQWIAALRQSVGL